METKPKSKAGRKRIKFDEETLEKIENWAGKGLSESQIADLLNCSLSTIARNKRNNDKFGTALKTGKARAIAAISNKVYENALEGKENSAFFFLRNRDPDNWSDRQEVNHNINLKQIMQNSKNRLIEGEIVEKQAISVPLPKKKLTEE
jgi:transcriptional regulator with XRE-family HTH domain|tara:strand:+ start:718 stop:1161 length:444 start_codon:yes stop_codon:yes gene_type:complete